MGWLKYVVAGVGGAIVGGPLGAAAAVGAVKAVSAVKDTIDDDKEKEAKLKADHAKQIEASRATQEKLNRELEENRKRETERIRLQQVAEENRRKAEIEKAKLDSEQKTQLVIALFAVGFAASHIDGHMSKDEMSELAQFTKEIHSGNLPASVTQKVMAYQKNPPSLQEAMAEIKRLSHPDYTLFRKLIELIINADGGTPAPEEIQFLKEYDACVSALK